jgi:site-specific DNA-adenine methylase
MLKTKTPFRYPGSKSRALAFLMSKLPLGIEEYREPFLGGGSLPLAFTQQNPEVPVWVNDLYEPLYNCWYHIQKHPDKLVDQLVYNKKHFIKATDLKQYVKENRQTMFDQNVSALDRAVMYYITNRCSFSGVSNSFSILASENEYTLKKIYQIPVYSNIIRNWKITNFSYEELLKDSDQCFLFLDPPYDIKTNDLYGENGSMHLTFSHKEFHKNVNDLKCQWMITYNNNTVLAQWYADYYQHVWNLTYSMNSQSPRYTESQKDNLELLITNYDWANHSEKSTFDQLFSMV